VRRSTPRPRPDAVEEVAARPWHARATLRRLARGAQNVKQRPFIGLFGTVLASSSIRLPRRRDAGGGLAVMSGISALVDRVGASVASPVRHGFHAGSTADSTTSLSYA
jgi:hypothetical protein